MHTTYTHETHGYGRIGGSGPDRPIGLCLASSGSAGGSGPTAPLQDTWLAALHVLDIIAPRRRAITPRLYTLLSVPYGARLMRTETLVESRSEPT